MAAKNTCSWRPSLFCPARLHTHFLGFRLVGGVEYTEVVPGQRIVAQVHFFAEKPTWRFTFEPAGGGTKVR